MGEELGEQIMEFLGIRIGNTLNIEAVLFMKSANSLGVISGGIEAIWD